MPVYVVTGASRGLGFALIKHLAADSSNTVFGLARDKDKTEASLAAEGSQSLNLHILPADVTDQPALDLAAQSVKGIVGENGGVDVLINNAGYRSHITHLKSIKSFENNLEAFLQDAQKNLDVRLFGTLQVTMAFLPLIRSGTLKKVVAISSGMGDIDLINEAKLSVAAPYAASKAALNVMMAKLHAAYEDEGILFMALCPGNVDTADGPVERSEEDMKDLQNLMLKLKAYASPDFRPRTPNEAAKDVMTAIDRSSLAGGHGGSFLSYNGTKRWM